MKLKKVLMTVLIAASPWAAMQQPVYAAPAAFREAASATVKEMSQIPENSFFSSLSFHSTEDITAFVNYFRREYYNGSQPLTFKYTVRSGLYRFWMEAPCPMETAAGEHEENTAAILDIARSLTGGSEEELVSNAASYVESILYYDYDAMAAILQERAGAAAETYKTVGHSLRTGSAICYDYALIAQRILQAAGVKAAVAMNGEHAFNLVRIDGRDYIYDLTAADTGCGKAVWKIPFSEEGVNMLQGMTGIDYSITIFFPEDYFEI